MKRIVHFFTAVLLTLFIVGCQIVPKNPFTEFISESDRYKNLTMPSGAGILSMSFKQDKDGHFTILDLTPKYDDNSDGKYKSDLYKWCALPHDKQIEDLKYFANIVKEYAAAKNLANYYLFISAGTPFFKFTYNPQEGALYCPDKTRMDVYYRMYNFFGTMDATQLAKDKDGQAFLVANHLAEQKYDTIENVKSPGSFYYRVDVINGSFSDSNKQWATVYKPK